jgi:hypothetical protein
MTPNEFILIRNNKCTAAPIISQNVMNCQEIRTASARALSQHSPFIKNVILRSSQHQTFDQSHHAILRGMT